MSFGRIERKKVPLQSIIAGLDVSPTIKKAKNVKFPLPKGGRIRAVRTKQVLTSVIGSPIFGILISLSPKPVAEMLEFIRKKVAEPSTLRGIATIAGVAGFAINPEFLETIAVLIGAAFGLIELLRSEDKVIITVEDADDEPAEN